MKTIFAVATFKSSNLQSIEDANARKLCSRLKPIKLTAAVQVSEQ